MNSSHVCLACRRRLGQVQSSYNKWHSRATFISLSGKPRITTDETQKDGAFKPEDELRDRMGRYANNSPGRKKIPSSRNAADELESLFERSLRPLAANATFEPPSSLEPYKHVETLKKMMLESYPLGECWSYFVEHFGPSGKKTVPANPRSLPSYLQSTSKNLLKKIIHAKRRNPFSQSLPRVSQLSEVHLQLGTLTGAEWTEMMFILLENISAIEKSSPKESPYDDQLLRDILLSWNTVSRNLGSLRDFPPPDSAINWSNIPLVTLKDAQHVYNKRGPQLMFGLLVPHFQSKTLSDLPLVALATYSLLTNELMIPKVKASEAEPLIANLRTMASVLGLNFNQIKSRTEHDLIATFVKDTWSGFRGRAIQKIAPTNEEDQELLSETSHWTTVNFPTNRINHNINFTTKRLYAALKQKNINQVEDLWSDMSTWPVSTKKGGQNPKGTLSFEICNYFILVYMSLRQTNRAIDVWNHMVKTGLKPEVTTWDAMLSGCKTSGDWRSMEEIWKKMMESGPQPDVFCWTTRISGLMSSKQPDLAIRALDEMGRLWMAAAEKKYPQMNLPQLQLVENVEGAVKPSIAPVNAAISYLLRNRKQETAQQILAWAAGFGVKPDIITYNIYLRPLIRNGNIQEAISLLKQMDADGVKADVTTFTTVLDEAFGKSNQRTLEEQRELVNAVFSEMENAGVDANLHTYGKIIYRLLQHPDANMSNVNFVLERMAKQGLQPSVHIYTTLLEYHFNQNPPNLDAARNTVERASMVVGVDRTFWDKAVECYAKVGETGAALRILGKLASERTRVGWIAMRALLQALAENQEWDLARRVVRDAIEDADGRLPDYTKATESYNNFWKLASDLKLVEAVEASK